MKTLIAGIGNIFMGDDGFGCEVLQRLAREPLPPEVDAFDFGIRGMDLALALGSGDYARAILVDTAQRGGTPGSLYLIEVPATGDDSNENPEIEPHAMDPARVLRLAATLGGHLPTTLVLACEPADLGGADGRMGLSNAVAASVEPALAELMRLLRPQPDMENNDGFETAAPTVGAQRLQEA